MASNQLEKELCTYCTHLKILKQMLKETRRVFDEINNASCFDAPNFNNCNNDLLDVVSPGVCESSSTQLRSQELTASTTNEWSLMSSDFNVKVNAEITSKEEQILRNLFKSLPTYIVLCASPLKKCQLINALLRQNDFLNLTDSDHLWRPLSFSYGARTRLEKIESDSLPLIDERNSSHRSFRFSSIKRQSGSFDRGEILAQPADSAKPCYVDIFHNSSLLQSGFHLVVPEIRPMQQFHWQKVFSFCANSYQPVFLMVLEGLSFSNEELELLDFMKSQFNQLNIFFLKVPPDVSPSPTTSPGNTTEQKETSLPLNSECQTLEQLFSFLSLSSSVENNSYTNSEGFISLPSSPSSYTSSTSQTTHHLEMVEDLNLLHGSLHRFIKRILQQQLLEGVSTMIKIHLRCLDSMINLAFNMARGPVRVPARIKFAKMKEEELYNSLMEMAVKKQDEVKKMICETVRSKKDELIEEAASCKITGVELSNDSSVGSRGDLKLCSSQIEDFVLSNLNSHIAGQLVSSVNVLRESFTGILSRCLASLEEMDVDSEGGASKTSKALKEITNTAYQVNITAPNNDSVMKTFIEKIKQLFHSMLSKSQMRVDSDWKKRVATEMLSTLTESRCQKLAKSICNQIKERLKRSHQQFETSLRQLENKHGRRIEKTEEHRLKVRKEFAPRVARLSLESRSLKDFILYDKPKVGHMIGNGQYGVVFACDSWKGQGLCAVKVLVPPDDKHWNDLAMEFYYTMNIPKHDRIVTLRGSVIDYSYNSSPAVMLVMDKMPMDLHAAIEKKLGWVERLQVSIDIIEGIRYLHSQGLIHRDIKLKNVLLDKNNRGKLTDLGFCKPEALMTYSIVGTPIHMAPELVSGRYDHSVDVYAFGILFWYICNGSVHLPLHFEKCSNKEVLWTAVKKGLRPEKPKDVDPECWELMLKCWHSNPDLRPLVGEIESTLRSIYQRIVGSLPPERTNEHAIKVSSSFDDNSDLSAVDEYYDMNSNDDDDDDGGDDGVF